MPCSAAALPQHLGRGRVQSTAPEMLSPALCCLQGDKVLFISLPFPPAFRRFCGVLELLWGSLSVGNIPVSIAAREAERCPACEISPPTSKGGCGCQTPPKSRWISWMLYFQTIFKTAWQNQAITCISSWKPGLICDQRKPLCFAEEH